MHILAKYHANGNADDPLVRFEFAEMQASIIQGEQKGRWSDLFATSKQIPSLSSVSPVHPSNASSQRATATASSSL